MKTTFIITAAVIVAVAIVIYDNYKAQKMVKDVIRIYENLLSARKLENRALRMRIEDMNREKNELLEKIKACQTIADIGASNVGASSEANVEFINVPKIRTPKNGPKFGEF